MALPYPWVQRASRYNDQNHYIEGVPWNLHKPPFNFPPPLETLSEDGPGKTHNLAKYLSVRVCAFAATCVSECACMFARVWLRVCAQTHTDGRDSAVRWCRSDRLCPVGG